MVDKVKVGKLNKRINKMKMMFSRERKALTALVNKDEDIVVSDRDDSSDDTDTAPDSLIDFKNSLINRSSPRKRRHNTAKWVWDVLSPQSKKKDDYLCP